MLPGIDEPATWISLLSLTSMEIVLGIDNIVFISILTSRLPKERQAAASRIGLGLALIARLGLLFTLRWIMGLTATWFTIFGNEISGRDTILIGGGLFLLVKAVLEIHKKVEGEDEQASGTGKPRAEWAVLLQIMAIDVVFSLDSVITAVGMVPADRIWVMVTAVIVSVLVMLAFASRISAFVLKHPSIKMLALSFLVLIGVLLLADGLGQKVPKAYVYFAMGFSLGVELLNMRFRKKRAAAETLAPSNADLPAVTKPAAAGSPPAVR